jgi:hypothetical protein
MIPKRAACKTRDHPYYNRSFEVCKHACKHLHSIDVEYGEALGSEVPYGSLIGALMYLATNTRPYIAYAVGQLSRFMASPTKAHWKMAKGVLPYLKGTPRHGLVYGSSGIVCGFADASYACCVDTRRSTTGFVCMMLRMSFDDLIRVCFEVHEIRCCWCCRSCCNTRRQ